MSRPGRADVVVLAGDAVGLAVGLELARRGLETVILEVGPGRSEGLVLPGLVNPQAHPRVEPEPVRDLALLSRHLYSDWIEQVEVEAGLSCEYDVRGGLTVALSGDEEVQLDRALDWQRARALPFEVLAAEEARGREPALGGAMQAAFSFPLDGQVEPARLLSALRLAAQRAGAILLPDVPGRPVSVEGGHAVGVEAPGGRIEAGAVVNAAGPWASLVRGVPAAPLIGMWGATAALDASSDADRLTRFVATPALCLIPRRDGTLLVASPAEPPGLNLRPSAGSIATLLEQGARVVPAVKDYAFGEVGGYRAVDTPDRIPVIGETAVGGYYLSVGHGARSVLVAPGAAVLLADLLGGKAPPLPMTPFSPARFDL